MTSIQGAMIEADFIYVNIQPNGAPGADDGKRALTVVGARAPSPVPGDAG
jgi:hypothetical protein